MQEGLLRVVGLDYRGTLPPSAFLVRPTGMDDISIIFLKKSHTGVDDLSIIFYESQKTQVLFVNSLPFNKHRFAPFSLLARLGPRPFQKDFQ